MRMCLRLFITFLKVSLFTLGGGLAMLPLIQREVVERKKWISAGDFLDMVAISNSLPGAICVNIATPIGYKLKGTWGAIFAALGAVLPPFIVIVIVASAFFGIKDNPAVEAMFKGIRPCVVSLIALAVVELSRTAEISKKKVAIPIAVTLAVVFAKIHPIYVVAFAAVVNAAWVALRGRVRST